MLGLDRSLGKLDKQGLKKAYRSRSLQLHPDKNPSPEASAAFKLVQEAYECLTDEKCLAEYEERLRHDEYSIAERRYLFKEKIIDHTMHALTQVHYVLSLASSHIYALGMDIWEMAGEFEMELFGMSHKIGQYALMACLILSKARIFLQVHGLAYLISKLNYELAKSRGMF